MNTISYIFSVIFFSVVAAVIGNGGNDVQPPSGAASDDMDIDDVERGTAPPMFPINDTLEDLLDNFDAYSRMRTMDEDDFDDLNAIRMIFDQNMRKRAEKYMYERKDWDGHVDQLLLLTTGNFENRFRMPKDHFDFLLEAIKEAITVDFA